MRFSPLFRALVLGGAALAGPACGPDAASNDPSKDPLMTTKGTGGGAATDGGATGGGTAMSGQGGGTDGNGGPGVW